MELTCESLKELLPEMIDGRLGQDAEEGAATHLATCDQCRLVVDETSRVRELAKEHGRSKMPEDARTRILAALQAEEGLVDDASL